MRYSHFGCFYSEGGMLFWLSVVVLIAIPALLAFFLAFYFFPLRGNRFAMAWAAVVAILAAAGLAWWWASSAESRASDAESRAEQKVKMDALLRCQKAIEVVAQYGKNSRPGYTAGKKIGDVWQFLWPHGSFHFKNGFGVDVPQSARCEVEASTGRIVYLFVSGQTIIQ